MESSSSSITKVLPGPLHGAASTLVARIMDMAHAFSINGYVANLRDHVPLTSIYLRLGRYFSLVSPRSSLVSLRQFLLICFFSSFGISGSASFVFFG